MLEAIISYSTYVFQFENLPAILRMKICVHRKMKLFLISSPGISLKKSLTTLANKHMLVMKTFGMSSPNPESTFVRHLLIFRPRM